MKTAICVLISIAVLELYSASAKDEKPQIVHQVFMEYPVEARKLRLEGSGRFVLDIDPTGRVTAVHVAISTGHRLLDNAAIKGFKQFRFKPGSPTRVQMPASYTMDR